MIYVLSGGGSGGTLEVTAPVGVTVTATKSGKTETKVANAQGKAVFKGLASGTWQLSISDGSQTSTPVSVMIEADYTVTLAFFSATINITYPAGAVCTATDGTTTFTAPNSSGTWALTVPNAGTWTVTASNGTQTKSAQVVISAEGESESVTLSYSLTLLSGTDQCTSVTGGWVVDDIVSSVNNANYYGCQAPTVTWGSNGVTLKPNKSGSLRTNQAINLSSFTTLTWTPSVETYSEVFLFTVVPNSGAVSNVLASANTKSGALDVSNINENCYIGINVSNSGQPNTTINNIVLS